MAFPTIEALTETTVASMTTTHNISLGAGGAVSAGDLLVMIVVGSQVGADETYTITDPSGFTLVFEDQWSVAGENRQNCGVYFKVAAGTEGGTTVNVATSASVSMVAHVYRIASGTHNSAVEAGARTEVEAANPNPPSLTPSWGSADTLWIAVLTSEDSDFFATAAPASYTNLTTEIADTTEDAVISSARRENATATEDPGAFTATSEKYQAFVLGIEPAGGGGGGTSEPQGGLIMLWVEVAGIELEAELASETDTATDASLVVELVLNAELASETDTASDATIRVELPFTAELASETDSASDATLAVEQAFTAELASETDTASDATFAIEVSLAAELASETDTASDASLVNELVVNAEAATETDTAADASLTTALSFVAELATETDSAFDATLVTELAFTAEAATETDTPSDGSLVTELVLIAELATETDTAFDALLEATENLNFDAELASETDTAFDASLSVAQRIEAEQATETDTASDALLTQETGFFAELALETDVAADASLVSQLVLVAELALETDTAFDATLLAAPLIDLVITIGPVSTGWNPGAPRREWEPSDPSAHWRTGRLRKT